MILLILVLVFISIAYVESFISAKKKWAELFLI